MHLCMHPLPCPSGSKTGCRVYRVVYILNPQRKSACLLHTGIIYMYRYINIPIYKYKPCTAPPRDLTYAAICWEAPDAFGFWGSFFFPFCWLSSFLPAPQHPTGCQLEKESWLSSPGRHIHSIAGDAPECYVLLRSPALQGITCCYTTPYIHISQVCIPKLSMSPPLPSLPPQANSAT